MRCEFNPFENIQSSNRFGGFIFKFGSSFVVFSISFCSKSNICLTIFDHRRQRCRARNIFDVSRTLAYFCSTLCSIIDDSTRMYTRPVSLTIIVSSGERYPHACLDEFTPRKSSLSQFGSGGDGPTIRFDIITTPNLCHSSFGCMFYNRDKCLAGLSMFHLLTKLCDDQTPVI